VKPAESRVLFANLTGKRIIDRPSPRFAGHQPAAPVTIRPFNPVSFKAKRRHGKSERQAGRLPGPGAVGTTPPQAYATYFVALILIGGLSFYAGTLKPKKVPSLPPPTAAAPLR
jgi:hypothetical protein